MKNPVSVLLFLLLPALLIAAGLYFQKDIFYSLGAIVLIFYIIMTVIEKFRRGKEK